MKAYTNTIQTKKQAVADAKRHRDLDMLVKGTYETEGSRGFRGCSVGCMYKPFRSNRGESLHKLSEPVHGIPESLTRLRDTIFEGLEDEQSKNFHVNFTASIHVGADLSKVTDKLMYFLLTDKEGISKHATEKVKVIINKIADMYKQRLAGKNPTREEWVKVRSAADAAADAADAADAAADAADAAYAADAAADAAYAAYAADAAADAAYAADAAAYAAARKKYFSKIAKQLIKLLKEEKAV